MTQKRIHALIPARAGSKGVPGKNVRLLDGHPLLSYSIAAARLCSDIDRTVVSTDSVDYAAVARTYGAETPFIRPSEHASDTAGDCDVIVHYLDWLRDNGNAEPDLIVFLRPTTPLRDPVHMTSALAALDANPLATSLRSAHELPEPPQKMFQIGGDGYWDGFFPDDPRPEYYNLPRQNFPAAYHPNGYVDVVRTDFVRNNDGLFGPRIIAHVTPVVTEIDREEDFDYLEYQSGRDPIRPLMAFLNSQVQSAKPQTAQKL